LRLEFQALLEARTQVIIFKKCVDISEDIFVDSWFEKIKANNQKYSKN